MNITVAMLVILNVTTLFFLVRGPLFGIHGKQRPFLAIQDFLIEELQLNEEQIKKMEALAQIHHKEMRKLHEVQRDLKRDFIDDLGNIDSNALETKLDRIGENQKALDREMHRHFSILRKMLNQDQQQKFDGVIRQALEQAGGGRGRPRGPNGPPPHRP